MKQGELKFQIIYFQSPRSTLRDCICWKLVLLKEFQIEHRASNHDKPVASLENFVLYVPDIAKCIADIQQSVLLLLS